MSPIRWLALLATAALLCGASCTPVHSDRPLGSVPFKARSIPALNEPEDLNGLWVLESGSRAGVPGPGPGPYIAWFDPASFRYSVLRGTMHSTPSAEAAQTAEMQGGELEIRSHRFGGEEWLFFNEEDRVQKGSFLWALARQVDVDTILIWDTARRIESFHAAVRGGQLPGRVVQELGSKERDADARVSLSGTGLGGHQTVILLALDGTHLDFIIEHRDEFFVKEAPSVLRRVARFPALKHPDFRLPKPQPAASASMSGSP